MKKWISICMIAILLCSTGCQKNSIKKSKGAGEEFILGQDDQPNFLSTSLAGVETENGYFLLSWILEYFDWKTKEVVPVCNKSECTHTRKDTECSAFNCSMSDEIMYYDNHIYYNNLECTKENALALNLYRMKLDGTEKEKLYDLYVLSNQEQSKVDLLGDMAVHRGYIYYVIQDYDESTKQKISRICRRKLQKDAKAEVIHERKGNDTSCAMGRGYGNGVYFVAYHNEENSETVVEELYKYDIQNETEEKLVSVQEENGLQSLYGYTVMDGDLYYKENDKVMRKEQNTGKETEILDVTEWKTEDTAGTWWLYSDREYLYLDNSEDKKLVVLDTAGKKVDEIIYGNSGTSTISYQGADDKCLFFSIEEENMKVVYYDKKQLGKGTFEVQELFERNGYGELVK